MIDQFKGISERFSARARDIPQYTNKIFSSFSKINWQRLKPSWSSSTLYFIIVLQFLVLVGGGLVGTWQYFKFVSSLKGDMKREIPKSIVEVTPVEQGTFETFTSTVGTLKAANYVIIRPEMDGKVKEVLFLSGEKVAKDEILLKLEDAVLEAVVREARAKVDLWKSKAQRAKILHEKKAGTLKDKEESLSQYIGAQAELDRALANLEKTRIRAPFDGTIGFKDVSIGAYVKAGEDIVTLDDTHNVKVEFRLPENMLDKVSIGNKVKLEIDGFPDNVYEASIEAIDTNIDPLGHSLRVRANLDQTEDLFKPGLFAKVKVLLNAHEDVLLVPEAALESRGTQEYVYIVVDGVAKRMPVKTGGRNGEKVEILAGLEPGQNVVIAGQIKVQDGFPVIPVPPNVLKRF